MALRKRGFWVGVFLFLAIIFLPSPAGLTESAWLVAAVAVLMVTWWATEAIPIPVTSLLPLALFPILGVTSIETAALPYANKNIYLFLGGFLIALSIERSGLHKRLALIMIKRLGSDGPKLIGGFMLVSALISMWVMNTSTTLMLLPIGLAICSVVAKTVPNMSEKDKSNFDKALLLSIAYAATIGGMSTLVGTAPNIVFSSFMQEIYGLEILCSSIQTIKKNVTRFDVKKFKDCHPLIYKDFLISGESIELKTKYKKLYMKQNI